MVSLLTLSVVEDPLQERCNIGVDAGSIGLGTASAVTDEADDLIAICVVVEPNKRSSRVVLFMTIKKTKRQTVGLVVLEKVILTCLLLLLLTKINFATKYCWQKH